MSDAAKKARDGASARSRAPSYSTRSGPGVGGPRGATVREAMSVVPGAPGGSPHRDQYSVGPRYGAKIGRPDYTEAAAR